MKERVGLSAMVLAGGILLVSCETPATGGSEATAAAEAAPPPPRPVAAPAVRKEAVESPALVPKPTPVVSNPKPPVAPESEARKAKGQVSQMDLGTLFELQGEGRAFVVDVRPAFFYSMSHIPGAISLPLKTFETGFPAKKAEFDAAVRAGKIIVLYCADENCPDGKITGDKLAEKGYSTSVYSGGWKEWKASGL